MSYLFRNGRPNSTGSTPLIFRAAAITFVDQITLSVLNLAIGMAFIYRSTPEQYGLYTFMMSIFYFFSSVQNATVNTPMIVLSPRLGSIDRRDFEKGLTGLLSVGIPCISILVLLITGVLKSACNANGLSLTYIVVFIVSIWPLMLRDFWRAEEYANLRPAVALRRDIIYSLLALAMLGLLIIFKAVSFGTVLPIMGVSAVTVFLHCHLEMLHPWPEWDLIRNAFHKLWPLSRWSLLGIASSSLQNNTYVYLPFFMIGIREVAYLAASRLVMMPGALLTTSWANYFKPLASKSLAMGAPGEAFRTLIKSTMALTILLILYTGTALFALKVVPKTWLPKNYQDVGIYVLFWAGIILLTSLRSNLSSLYQANLFFRKLALLGVLSAILTFVMSALLIVKVGVLGALLGLALGEVFLTICLLLSLRSMLFVKSTQSDMKL